MHSIAVERSATEVRPCVRFESSSLTSWIGAAGLDGGGRTGHRGLLDSRLGCWGECTAACRKPPHFISGRGISPHRAGNELRGMLLRV